MIHLEQLSLNLDVPIEQSKLEKNPMVRVFGYGPKEKRCKHCKHLYSKLFANRYYKCELRRNSNSQATDHRVNWSACSKFAEEGESE